MTDARPASPDREANLAAVDPRLLTELQFPLALVRPNGMPWLQALLKLGEVANTIVPLMGVWMARWSAVLDYEGSDQPLVHARWVDGAVAEAEQGPAAPAPPVVRPVQPSAQHTHSTFVHRQTEVTNRPAITATQVSTRSTVREVRPVVEARPVRADVAPMEPPRVVESAAAEPSPATPPSEAATVSPATSLDAPTVVSAPLSPSAAPGAPLVHDRASAAQDAAAPTTSTVSVAPVPPAAARAPSPASARSPDAFPAASPVPASPAPPRAVAEPTPAAPAAVRVYDDAAATSGGRRSRVVSRSVTTRRPDGRVVPVAAAAPTPAPARVRTVAEIGAASTPIAVGAPSRTDSAAPPMPAVAAEAPAGRSTTPLAHGAPAATGVAPRSASATRPVVRAAPVPAAQVRPTDVVQGAPAAAAAPGPSIVHARPVVAATPTPGPSAPGPVPGPTRPSPAFTPVGVPRTADEARRMLGMSAPTAAPPAPAPVTAEAPAASATEAPLSPRQMSNITQVVQTRVIRHLERERERTRTRV